MPKQKFALNGILGSETHRFFRVWISQITGVKLKSTGKLNDPDCFLPLEEILTRWEVQTRFSYLLKVSHKKVDKQLVIVGNKLDCGPNIYQGTIEGRDVAIKIYPTQSCTLTEFYDEAKFLGALSHPNLLQFIGSSMDVDGNETGNYMLITELCKFSAADLLPLPLDKVMKYGFQVSSALNYLHTAGIVHRNIKASTVLIDKFDTAKLSSLELTKQMNNERTGNKWIAPEILTGEPYTIPTDIYAFGLLIYEFVTKKDPNQDSNSLGYKEVEKNRRLKLPKNLPIGLVNLINSCWERKPTKRPTMSTIGR
eukprot:TRINITY_DN29867_c0_g1_i1.p1 TRINITY_DN29867_c0_g1~~TRINITY_DN29867_c0_g1_i1.p1  ORF type:complete len:310 (-),score=50.60 TRINITY_DN29867_c0_g1_i1:28-957(-)